MNEREIFDRALDLKTPAERHSFLDQVCGADVALRARILGLLASAEGASQFLNESAPRQLGQPTATDHTSRTAVYSSRDDVGEREADDDDDPAATTDLSFLQPSTKPGSIGSLGHYEILRVLGQGAFGIVFQAFDEKLHRFVAIKAMNPQLAATSPPRKRFLREARSAAAIRHENIVQVYSVEEQPLPYLVMEYIEGETLMTKLESAGPLDLADVLHLGRQMASGLAAAHAQGLIHRDIKPGNILLERGAERRVKITDFGLARAADDASMTRTGTIAGTPMYMAPEQALGHTLDHRADLFSLGSVLYQMASGRPPFRGATTMAVLKRVIDDTPRPIQEIIPEVPDWLCGLIARLQAKDPAHRPSSAREVAELLERWLAEWRSGRGVTAARFAPPVAPPAASPTAPASASAPRNSTPSRTRSPALAIALIAALGLLAVIGYWIRESGRNPDSVAGSGDTGKPSPGESSSNGSTSNNAATAQSKSTDSKPAGWHGWPADAPAPARAPFDAGQAQAAWAKYLKIPVEYVSPLGLRFRLIPPGEFDYGTADAEAKILVALAGATDESTREKFASEAPARRVVLTQPFYLCSHELTQRQFSEVLGRNPSYCAPQGLGADLVRGIDTGDFPVESITWIDVVEFCNALSVRDKLWPCYEPQRPFGALNGNGYRLPTEAEWEFACKAGGESTFWTGAAAADFAAAEWSAENSGGRTHAVGEQRANAFGLHDMCGNVGEWVEDHWAMQRFPADSLAPPLDPLIVNQTVSYRTVRGGSWGAPAPLYGRSAARTFGPIDAPNGSIGARLALSVAAVRADLEYRETVAESQGVTIRGLTKGYEIVTPVYRARVAPTGLLHGVEVAGITCIRSLQFGGGINGMGWNGPVDIRPAGNSIVCDQDGEYQLKYEFDAKGITVDVRMTTAAATRDGPDGKPYYVAVHVLWGDSVEKVRRLNPMEGQKAEFTLPATGLELLIDYRILFPGERFVEVHSPLSECGFGYPNRGPRELWNGYLTLDADNRFRFDFSPPPAVPR